VENFMYFVITPMGHPIPETVSQTERDAIAVFCRIAKIEWGSAEEQGYELIKIM